MIHDGFGIEITFLKVTIVQLKSVILIITHSLFYEKRIVCSESVSNKSQLSGKRHLYRHLRFCLRKKIILLRMFSVERALQ